MILPRTQLFVLWIDNVVQWYVADHQTTPDLLRRCLLVLSSHAVSPSGLTTDSLGLHPAQRLTGERTLNGFFRTQCVFPMRFWDASIVPETCQWCNRLHLSNQNKKNARPSTYFAWDSLSLKDFPLSNFCRGYRLLVLNFFQGQTSI